MKPHETMTNPSTENDKIPLSAVGLGSGFWVHVKEGRMTGEEGSPLALTNSMVKRRLSNDLTQILSAPDLLEELAEAARKDKKKVAMKVDDRGKSASALFDDDDDASPAEPDGSEKGGGEKEDCTASNGDGVFRTHRIRTNFGDEDSKRYENDDEEAMTVENSPWVDHKGNSGFYTGEVNKHNQPHGYGVHVYGNDSKKWHTCYWQNGLPLKHWEPKCLKNQEKEGIEVENLKRADSFYEPAIGMKKESKQKQKKRGSSVSWASDGSLTAAMSLGDMFDELDDIFNPSQWDEDGIFNAQQADSSIGSSNGENEASTSKLRLGDTALQGDMVVDSPRSEIESLKVHDFAFIQRSDKITWTYAILASKDEESMLFVLNQKGSKKKLRARDWGTRMRLVNSNRQRVEHQRDSMPHANMPVPSVTAEDKIPAIGARRRVSRQRSSSCDAENRQSLSRRSETAFDTGSFTRCASTENDRRRGVNRKGSVLSLFD